MGSSRAGLVPLHLKAEEVTVAYPHKTEPIGGGVLKVTVDCHICQKECTFEVPLIGYRQWRDRGVYIQDALQSVPTFVGVGQCGLDARAVIRRTTTPINGPAARTIR